VSERWYRLHHDEGCEAYRPAGDLYILNGCDCARRELAAAHADLLATLTAERDEAREQVRKHSADADRLFQERNHIMSESALALSTLQAEVAALRAALEALMPHVRHTGSCAEQAVASLLRREQPQCVCGRDAAAHSARALLPRPGDQP
jgi:hypothetical protein